MAPVRADLEPDAASDAPSDPQKRSYLPPEGVDPCARGSPPDDGISSILPPRGRQSGDARRASPARAPSTPVSSSVFWKSSQCRAEAVLDAIGPRRDVELTRSARSKRFDAPRCSTRGAAAVLPFGGVPSQGRRPAGQAISAVSALRSNAPLMIASHRTLEHSTTRLVRPAVLPFLQLKAAPCTPARVAGPEVPGGNLEVTVLARGDDEAHRHHRHRRLWALLQLRQSTGSPAVPPTSSVRRSLHSGHCKPSRETDGVQDAREAVPRWQHQGVHGRVAGNSVTWSRDPNCGSWITCAWSIPGAAPSGPFIEASDDGRQRCRHAWLARKSTIAPALRS